MPFRPLSSSSASVSARRSRVAPVGSGRPRASSPPSPPPPQGGDDRGELPSQGWAEIAPEVSARPRLMGRTPPLVPSALTFVVLLVALSACGGGDNGEDVGTSSATTSAKTTPTGEFDTVAPPSTFALEDGALATGAEGLPVRRLQEALLVLGLDPGAVDGVFGPATRRAVIDFQRESGLEADGVVGQETADAINEALESRTTTDN